MFSGFWSWFLVVVLVVVIFSADRLPEFKRWIDGLAKDSVKVAQKGAQVAQEKIAKAKEKAEKKSAKKNDEE